MRYFPPCPIRCGDRSSASSQMALTTKRAAPSSCRSASQPPRTTSGSCVRPASSNSITGAPRFSTRYEQPNSKCGSRGCFRLSFKLPATKHPLPPPTGPDRRRQARQPSPPIWQQSCLSDYSHGAKAPSCETRWRPETCGTVNRNGKSCSSQKLKRVTSMGGAARKPVLQAPLEFAGFGTGRFRDAERQSFCTFHAFEPVSPWAHTGPRRVGCP
jgi:hypothetical protein